MPQKTKGYSHAKADAAKDKRRAEGEVRNAAWRRLSRSEKLVELHGRPGECARQIKNLNSI
jgi:hypothetical protein